MMSKTRLIQMMMTCCLLAVAGMMRAQTVVSGVVKDRQTGGALSHVSVTAEGTNVHTVTNEDGRFTLKTTHRPKYILLTHIGYQSRRQQLNEGPTEHLKILMTASTIQLDEVFVSVDDPLDIVLAAMSRIERNYSNESELVRCFYRETARKGSRFISVAEAVTEMYKTSYAYGPESDAMVIRKGRRLMSMKSADTLGVKVQGGPVMPLMADVAKNPEYMLNMDDLKCCDLFLEIPEMIDNRPHYVVRVEPRPITLWPLMGGKLFIDRQSLTITRAELHLDVRDWRKASNYMLVKKPVGLHFRPKALMMTILYHTDMNGITRMSYIRNEMRFTCDWKRRVFASPFTTVTEMVVTSPLAQGRQVKRPQGRSSFGMRERFYDKVEYFEDPDFWADYNIIEPTESLEHAIDKLKKKVNSEK